LTAGPASRAADPRGPQDGYQPPGLSAAQAYVPLAIWQLAPAPQIAPAPASAGMAPNVGEHTTALVVDSVLGDCGELLLEQPMRDTIQAVNK
jgi:hypothetical protein